MCAKGIPNRPEAQTEIDTQRQDSFKQDARRRSRDKPSRERGWYEVEAKNPTKNPRTKKILIRRISKTT